MPSKPAKVKNPKQYEALKDKGMSKQRAAKIANSPGASKRGQEVRLRRQRVSGRHSRATQGCRPQGRKSEFEEVLSDTGHSSAGSCSRASV
jgi:hypothetical protein